jgi:hypothetical protein
MLGQKPSGEKPAENNAAEEAGRGSAPDPFAGMAAMVSTFLLCLVIGGLVGVPLWFDGFLFDPGATIIKWSCMFSVWLAAVGGLRLLWWIGVMRRPIRLEIRSVAVILGSILGSVVTLGFLASIYSWGKLMVPLFHAAGFDQQLHDWTVWMHGGVDPNIFLMTIFSGFPAAEQFLDFVYGHYLSFVLLSTAWYLTSPENTTRQRYVRGFVLVWGLGLAGYWLVPALGPVFVFEDVATAVSAHYPRAASAQFMLIKNYQNVIALLGGAQVQVSPVLGVAAMPSLHVALPTFVYLFSAERSERTRYIILPFLVSILVGSVATGWHYAIDSYVGAILGWVCWLAVRRPVGNLVAEGGQAER